MNPMMKYFDPVAEVRDADTWDDTQDPFDKAATIESAGIIAFDDDVEVEFIDHA